jgi:hypothetical protein
MAHQLRERSWKVTEDAAGELAAMINLAAPAEND